MIPLLITSYQKKNNARDTNYFTKNFTKCLCGEWLLVNEKNDINGESRWKPIKSWLH